MARRASVLRTVLLLGTIWAGPAFAQDAGTPAATCAATYHERLSAIAGTQLPAYRKAPTAIGSVDPRLPGRPVFAAPRRPDLEAGARHALDLAENLVRRQGRTSFARDANTRWIAERIREDLTDYLRQGPSPFLCAGVEPYLATLRTYAAQGAPSPTLVSQSAQAHRQTVSSSLDGAFRAMRPAPLPRFAPADRPSAPAIDGLRIAVEMGLREPRSDEAPTRLAERNARTRISDSRTDPGLPPRDPAAARALASDADLMRAITALTGTAARAGFMKDAGPRSGADTLAERPVLARLIALRDHMRTPAGTLSDPIVRPAVEQALADLERLDYLLAARDGSADPLTDAMYATMSAIETAHAEACGCAD